MANIELTRIISASFTHDGAVEFLVEATVNGQAFDEITHTYVEGKEDDINEACRVWLDSNTPTAFVEYQPDDEELALKVRKERDDLLASTDWWAVQDRTMTEAERQYRQALRDITTQQGFPHEVEWPTQPEV